MEEKKLYNAVQKFIPLEGGREIMIETGKLAKQADGSVVVKQGDTMLLATVVAAKDAKEGVDFGRRWAVSFVPFTLGGFDKEPTTTFYHNSQLESDAVPVGTLYYNTKSGKVGCYTAEGWKYLKFE